MPAPGTPSRPDYYNIRIDNVAKAGFNARGLLDNVEFERLKKTIVEEVNTRLRQVGGAAAGFKARGSDPILKDQVSAMSINLRPFQAKGQTALEQEMRKAVENAINDFGPVAGGLITADDLITARVQRDAVRFTPKMINLPAGVPQDSAAYKKMLREIRHVSGGRGSILKDTQQFAYNDGTDAAVTTASGRPIKLETAVRRVMANAQAEYDARNDTDINLINTAFGAGTADRSTSDDDLQQLVTAARSTTRNRYKSGSTAAQAASRRQAINANFDQLYTKQSANLEELLTRSGAVGVAAGAATDAQLDAAAEYAARNGMPSGTMGGVPREFSQRVARKVSEQRQAGLVGDTVYQDRMRDLAYQAKQDRANWEQRVFGNPANMDPIAVQWRRVQKRRQESEDLRGSGRTGRLLRRLGVGSKTAGRVGRVFGAIGSAAIIVAAIVGMAKLIVDAINRIGKLIVDRGASSYSQQALSISLGTSPSAIATYEQFKKTSTMRGAPVDFAKAAQGVALAGGSVVNNTAGAENLVKAAALLDAGAGGSGSIEKATALMTNARGNSAGVTEQLWSMGIKAILSGRSLISGRNAPEDQVLQEVLANLDLVGAGGDNFVNYYTQLKNDPVAMARFKQNIDAGHFEGSVRQGMVDMDYSSGLAGGYRSNDLLEQASRDLANGIISLNEGVKQLTNEMLRNLSLAFGDRMLNIMDGFQHFMVWLLSKLPGYDSKPLINEMNEQTKVRYQNQIALHNAEIAGDEGVAVNQFNTLMRGPLSTLSPEDARQKNVYFTKNFKRLAREFYKTGNIPDELMPYIGSDPQRKTAFALAAFRQIGADRMQDKVNDMQTEVDTDHDGSLMRQDLLSVTRSSVFSQVNSEVEKNMQKYADYKNDGVDFYERYHNWHDRNDGSGDNAADVRTGWQRAIDSGDVQSANIYAQWYNQTKSGTKQAQSAAIHGLKTSADTLFSDNDFIRDLGQALSGTMTIQNTPAPPLVLKTDATFGEVNVNVRGTNIPKWLTVDGSTSVPAQMLYNPVPLNNAPSTP